MLYLTRDSINCIFQQGSKFKLNQLFKSFKPRREMFDMYFRNSFLIKTRNFNTFVIIFLN